MIVLLNKNQLSICLSVNLKMILAALLLVAPLVSAQDPEWQKYIIGPKSRDVRPLNVIAINGNVTNPAGLLPDSGEAIFTRSQGDDTPMAVIDFGMVTVGFLKINFTGATPNIGVRLAFSETTQFLTNVSDYSRSSTGTDQIAVNSSSFSWTDSPGCKVNNKVCSDGLHAFRYVRLYVDALESDAPETTSFGFVKIQGVSLEYTGFLPTVDSFQGWFECSDENLTKLWYAGVYTNDLTTDTFRATDVDPRDAASPTLEGKVVLFDGAKRDRDPYVGDIAISGLTSYLSHGSLASDAARNVLADLMDHQREDGWIPPASIFNYTLTLFDYPLWWIISAWDYVLYTGDTSFIDSYFPNIVKVLDSYYPANTNASSNLLSRPSGYGDYAFIPRDGESLYYNALYVFALDYASKIASRMSNATFVEKWQNRSSLVANAVNDLFWDENVGAYRNFRYESSSHPQDGNALAVVAGIADRSRAESVLQYLNNTNNRFYGNAFMDDDSLVSGGSQRVYAFMSTFEIRARFEQILTSSALDQIRRTFGWMFLEDPGTTFWEGIGPEGSMYEGAFTSAAHGWSTGVVSLLTQHILGLQLTDSDCSFLVNPRTGEITWAKGAVPTPYGPYNIDWSLSDGFLSFNVVPPEGCSGKVVVPVPNTPELTVTHNGRLVWNNGKAMGEASLNDEGFVVVNNIHGGRHNIVAYA